MVEQKKLTKGKAALLLILAAAGAIASAKVLAGWYVYAGFAVVGLGLFIAFVLLNRKA